VNGKYISEFKYIYQPLTANLRYSWSILDYLTIDDVKGLSCYVIYKDRFFWTSPIYGSRLQNRLWNVETDNHSAPDALLYYFHPQQGRFSKYSRKTIFDRWIIPLNAALKNRRYELVHHDGQIYLFIRKDFLTADKRSRLIQCFKILYPHNDGSLNK
jgi:hypothetical protein